MFYIPPPKSFVASQCDETGTNPATTATANTASPSLLTVDIENSVDEVTLPSSSLQPTTSIFVNARIRTISNKTREEIIAQRPPLHLTVCQDVSSSMTGARLDMCKTALNFVVDKLNENDRFGLITFGSRSREVVPLIPMTEGEPILTSGKESAKRSIGDIEASGNTALADGLMQALRQAPFTPVITKPKVAVNVPPTIVVSHTLTRNTKTAVGATQYNYTLTIVTPQKDHGRVRFEIKAPNEAASLNGSGDVELELAPMRQPIEKVSITFYAKKESSNNNSSQQEDEFSSTHDYYLGESLLKKQHFQLKNPSSAQDSAASDESKKKLRVAVSNQQPVRAILLFTDGNVNSGTTNIHQMKRDVQRELDSYRTRNGTRPLLFTFGFGNETNASLLRDLAQLTQSSFYHINNTPSLIPRVFADVLGGLFSIASQNVVLSIKPNTAHGISIGKIMCGNFSMIKKPLHNQDSSSSTTDIEIGNMFEDEARDVLVEVIFNGADSRIRAASSFPRMFAPVDVCLRYNEINGNNQNDTKTAKTPAIVFLSAGTPRELNYSSTIRVVDQTTGVLGKPQNQVRPNNFVESVYHRFRTQESLEEVRRLADTGAVKAAQEHAIALCQRLEDVLAQIHREQRLQRDNISSSSSTAKKNDNNNANRSCVELCLSQANHVASTALTSDLEYTVGEGQQTLNSYACELGLQRNNNSYGVGGGDVGERARSLFQINSVREEMRKEIGRQISNMQNEN